MGHMSLGREGKVHDRRKLRGLLAKANPFADKRKEGDVLLHSPPPPPRPPKRSPLALIDCCAHLLSRQLSRDQGRMLSRAFDGGVEGVVALCNDWERQAELSALVKEYPGQLFGAYGVHPDSVKKGLADKAVETMLKDLRAAALVPECVALQTGLDFTREMACHHAQEKLFDAHLALAADIRLPVLVSCAGEGALEMAAEKLAAWRAGGGEGAAAAGGGGGGQAPPRRDFGL